MKRLRTLVAMLAGILLCAAPFASAQYPPPDQPPPGTAPPQLLPQDQLDALLAPIALYPDELLTQVLMASTYPLEVVEAARFVKANPTLRGPALDDALKDKNWDPSVLSLAPFPQVLDMMNEKLEWTQRLGDAFLADEAGVMRTVQMLRQRAQQAGNLQSTEQQRVYVQDRNIIIEPAQPEYIYVPVYNPLVIYGPWWVPAYRPWYWYPPPIWGYPPAPLGWGVTAGFYWGSAWVVHRSYWGWARPNWTNNNVNININVTNNYWASRALYRDRYPNGTGTWTHVPEHRRGVAYRDAATYNRYRPTNPNAVQTRENYRGNAARPTTLQGTASGTGQPAIQPGTRPTSPALPQPGARPAPGSPTQPSVGAMATQPGAGPTGTTRDARERAVRTPQGQPTYGGAPQTFQTQPRPQVQMESNRGQASRQQMIQTPEAYRGQAKGQMNQPQEGPRGQAKGQQGNPPRGERQQGSPGEGGGKSR
jgi:hypothetical protein